ncbi:hypothetical protein F2P56_013502, partial [Juglans regia]
FSCTNYHPSPLPGGLLNFSKGTPPLRMQTSNDYRQCTLLHFPQNLCDPICTWFSYHSLTASSRPDLLGFGLTLMKEQDPFALIGCDSRIHSLSDLGLCKDIYCREKDLSF